MSTSMQNIVEEKFSFGSSWFKADFHMHTKEDKEFNYSGFEDNYIESYIKKLDDTGISIGVITNHNKFALSEYKALKKAARKEGIFLMPGMELSVKDGSNGLHTLVVFSDEWIFNTENKDYINDFIGVTFSGQPNFENKNARSNHDLLSTIAVLDKYTKDYFLVFAHVEADNGLWGGLSGGRLTELGKQNAFKEKTLAFQKVRTLDQKTKVQGWLNGWYPAEVEGSDCKSIDSIGVNKACFLKLGEFSFEAVKYALTDFQNRLSHEKPVYQHSRITKIAFEGGVLDSKTICFSPELNSLIGIRGSGKSAILEAIRYVLDIPFGEKASDTEYKKELIRYIFGSGGKVAIIAIDRHGKEYEIRRILNEYPEVYVDNNSEPGIKIRETIIQKPIYFGQKDLSSTGEGFEKDLVEKLVGEKLEGIRNKIIEQENQVKETVDRLQKLSSLEDQKVDYQKRKQDAEFRLKVFKDFNVEEKLEKRVNFDADARRIKQVIDSWDDYHKELAGFIDRFDEDISKLSKYTSKQNAEFFETFNVIVQKVIDSFSNLKKALADSRSAGAELGKKSEEFKQLRMGLVEEFAEVERKLTGELKEQGASSVRPDEFIKLRKTVEQTEQMLTALEKQHEQKATVSADLLKNLAGLNELWHLEFKTIQNELNKINDTDSALTIDGEFKGDKDAFLTFMSDIFRGSRIRETTFKSLLENYSDFIAIFKDFENAKAKSGSSPDTFEKYFFDNLGSLLVYQIPNKFRIKYRGKELKHHSLGQRASALILFVLSQRENDVIIIDQPEDDLDNQTIYEDVIKLIRRLKKGIQFIFATHNANFPVLGDAEQIHSCSFSDDEISLKSGSIDDPGLQKEIVNIMEGGEEAFNKRKEIYKIWNPQKYLKS